MKIYLISATSLSGGMTEFLHDRGLDWHRDDNACDSELTVEAAGRLCYMSFGELQYRQTTKKYIENIIAQGHDSVLEHANFTILVDGISRGLSHQLVRHRIGFSYSQLSQQYHDESGAEFTEPPDLRRNPKLFKKWEEWKEQTLSLYGELLSERDKLSEDDRVVRKEEFRLSRTSARSVLPNATATSIVITGNARAWRNFIKVRGAIVGDVEMREYSVAVYRLLESSAPNLFQGFEVINDKIGEFVRSQDV